MREIGRRADEVVGTVPPMVCGIGDWNARWSKCRRTLVIRSLMSRVGALSLGVLAPAPSRTLQKMR